MQNDKGAKDNLSWTTFIRNASSSRDAELLGILCALQIAKNLMQSGQKPGATNIMIFFDCQRVLRHLAGESIHWVENTHSRSMKRGVQHFLDYFQDNRIPIALHWIPGYGGRRRLPPMKVADTMAKSVLNLLSTVGIMRQDRTYVFVTINWENALPKANDLVDVGHSINSCQRVGIDRFDYYLWRSGRVPYLKWPFPTPFLKDWWILWAVDGNMDETIDWCPWSIFRSPLPSLDGSERGHGDPKGEEKTPNDGVSCSSVESGDGLSLKRKWDYLE